MLLINGELIFELIISCCKQLSNFTYIWILIFGDVSMCILWCITYHLKQETITEIIFRPWVSYVMAIGRRPAEPFAWRIYGLAKYRKRSANRTDVVHIVFIFSNSWLFDFDRTVSRRQWSSVNKSMDWRLFFTMSISPCVWPKTKKI